MTHFTCTYIQICTAVAPFGQVRGRAQRQETREERGWRGLTINSCFFRRVLLFRQRLYVMMYCRPLFACSMLHVVLLLKLIDARECLRWLRNIWFRHREEGSMCWLHRSCRETNPYMYSFFARPVMARTLQSLTSFLRITHSILGSCPPTGRIELSSSDDNDIASLSHLLPSTKHIN